jgi:ABC-type phosphate transport system substrate-binding protein
MRDKGYEPHDVSSLRSRVVGKDIIRFMTYKAGPDQLSIDQLVGIVSGKVKNWKEIGGEDRAIILILSAAQPNTDTFVEGRLLRGQKINKADAKFTSAAAGTGALVKEIGSTPGAVGYGSIKFVYSSVKVPKQPTIGRPITFMWRGQPSKYLQTLFEFIDNENRTNGLD